VFAGHYHKAQRVFKNAWHVGSAYRVDFSEEEDAKVFIAYDNGKVTFVPFQVPKMKTHLVANGITNMNIDKFKVKSDDTFVRAILKGTEDFV
jgi:hypothetical protein